MRISIVIVFEDQQNYVQDLFFNIQYNYPFYRTKNKEEEKVNEVNLVDKAI